jgi:hypothetical protein
MDGFQPLDFLNLHYILLLCDAINAKRSLAHLLHAEKGIGDGVVFLLFFIY